ncbi:MAG: hypothetical protein K8F27_00555 [Sulfuricellaceae bacterium]|nr:hypothetical protein [Sulfuricellaceae bacterium]
MVTAIFLLVVLAALGGFIVSIFTSQQQTSALDLQGERAYQAARSGIEWGVYQIASPENLNYGKTAAPFTIQYACAGSPATLNGLGGSLAGFAVTVTCSFSDHTEGSNLIRVYQLTSTATAGGAVGNGDYVERRVDLTTSTCRQALDDQEC